MGIKHNGFIPSKIGPGTHARGGNGFEPSASCMVIHNDFIPSREGPGPHARAGNGFDQGTS
jgi:hypothetical protein